MPLFALFLGSALASPLTVERTIVLEVAAPQIDESIRDAAQLEANVAEALKEENLTFQPLAEKPTTTLNGELVPLAPPVVRISIERRTFELGAEEALAGDASWAASEYGWPWGWVDPPKRLRAGATWNGTRRQHLMMGDTPFDYTCTVVSRARKGGEIRCSGKAASLPFPGCVESPCVADDGGRFDLEVTLDPATGAPIAWKRVHVQLTGVNGGVVRTTSTIEARVGP